MAETVGNEELDALTGQLSNELQKIADDLEAEIADIQPPEEPNNVEAVVGIRIEVKWKNKRFSYDLPRIDMERDSIKFDLPEVHMQTEDFSFDVPATRMVRKEIGKKPVWHHWHLSWEPIYGKMPEVYMKRVEVKFDVPKVNMKRQEIKMDIPKITMERHDFTLKIPRFKVIDIEAELRVHEEKVNDCVSHAQLRSAELEASFKQKGKNVTIKALTERFDTAKDELVIKRNEVSDTFESAISKLKSSINTARNNNISSVVSEMEGKLNTIVSQYNSALAQIDTAIQKISAQESAAIELVNSQFS